MGSKSWGIPALLLLLNTGCWSGGFDLPKDFASTTPLSLTGVSPTSSFLPGGGTLTLTGDEFASGMTVQVGGSDCTGVSVTTATAATCTLPAHAAGTLDVVATLADGTSATLSSAIVYSAAPVAPTVSAISPSSGVTTATQSVTINGTAFQSGATVTVGGSACTSVNVSSATTLTCTAPTGSGAGSVNVVVANPDALNGTLTNGYTYRVAPTYTALKTAVLTPKCSGCHGASGGLTVGTYASISSRVVAGNPSGSLLLQRVASDSMPQGGPALSTSEKQQISDWILAGGLNN